MDARESLLLSTVAVPLAGAFALPLLGRLGERPRNVAALLLVLYAFFASAALLPLVLADGTATWSVAGVAVLHADRLAVFMALVSLGVGALIVLYSFGYIAPYAHRDEYYFMVVLFLGAMSGLIYARNLIAIFFFWEITAIVCWRLIGFFREPEIVRRADKAFLITVFGALLMLVGFVAVYDQTGSFDLGAIAVACRTQPISDAALLLILCGILAKSATLPFHTWLPDAGVAPSPVTALLHAAVLVKIGVYVFARLFVATFTIDPQWHVAVPVIAGVSAIVSAGAAFVETDIKRIVAYSTISQLAFILLGLSVGNELGVAGGLLYILMHGIAKGGLFLCAGVVEQRTHVKEITRLGGLARTMPVTAVSFALCAFSVMGIPPFGGFFGKYMVIGAALEANQLGVAVAFFAGACLTILYLLRAFTTVFLGAPTSGEEPPAEGSPVMVGTVGALGALSLASGLLVHYPSRLVVPAVRHMLRIS